MQEGERGRRQETVKKIPGPYWFPPQWWYRGCGGSSTEPPNTSAWRCPGQTISPIGSGVTLCRCAGLNTVSSEF